MGEFYTIQVQPCILMAGIRIDVDSSLSVLFMVKKGLTIHGRYQTFMSCLETELTGGQKMLVQRINTCVVFSVVYVSWCMIALFSMGSFQMSIFQSLLYQLAVRALRLPGTTIIAGH